MTNLDKRNGFTLTLRLLMMLSSKYHVITLAIYGSLLRNVYVQLILAIESVTKMNSVQTILNDAEY